MIEILTVDKLNDYGFNEDQINRLLTWDNYETAFHNLPKGIYWASNIEQKIYSGADAERKINFKKTYESFPHNPDLIPEYFELKKSRYLIDQKTKGGKLFKESAAIERFIQSEIELAKNTIEYRKPYVKFKNFREQDEIITMYIDWLKSCKIIPQEEIFLSSLADNNEYFQSYISEYYKKQKTASKFLNRVEFINEEIERVEKVFIQRSIITTISGGEIIAEFNPSKYTKLAYDWLKSGEDWPVNTILKKAMIEYGQYKKQSSHNYSEIEDNLDTEEMKKHVISHLKVGVAYLKYQKFLKEQLGFAGEQANIEKSLGSFSNDKFIEIYNTEVTEEKIKELEENLNKIKSPYYKLKFLEEEKARYLKHLKPQVLASSGTVSFPNFRSGEPLYFDRIIQIEIDKINENQKLNLASIFNENNNAFEVCKGLFEYLEITIDGKPNVHKLKKGRSGCLTGLIAAIKSTPGMLKLDKATELQLLSYFNSYLNTDYRTFSKRNKNYQESIDESNRYIQQNFKK